MVTEIQYTSIKRVLDNIMDHPLLRDVTLEQVIKHTLRFISLHGYTKLYQDKIDTVHIKDFRGLLPCDLVSIIQVKDLKSNICLAVMTDSFAPEGKNNTEYSFKTQGKVIYTSFPEGMVEISYRAIPVDEEGFPLLVDNETYLNALEAYIKMKVFTIKFDTGKIQAGVLSNAQTEYAWASHLVQQEFLIPSMAEMESITRMLNTMIKPVREFDKGFKNLGNREYLRRH